MGVYVIMCIDVCVCVCVILWCALVTTAVREDGIHALCELIPVLHAADCKAQCDIPGCSLLSSTVGDEPSESLAWWMVFVLSLIQNSRFLLQCFKAHSQ